MGEAVSQGRAQAVVRDNSLLNFSAATTGKPFSQLMRNYQFFRDALVEAAGRFGLAIHGYVWMTNHIHLLASPLYADSIGKTLQSVGRP